ELSLEPVEPIEDVGARRLGPGQDPHVVLEVSAAVGMGEHAVQRRDVVLHDRQRQAGALVLVDTDQQCVAMLEHVYPPPPGAQPSTCAMSRILPMTSPPLESLSTAVLPSTGPRRCHAPTARDPCLPPPRLPLGHRSEVCADFDTRPHTSGPP